MAVRVDKWLWAVRVYKTRTQSTDACTSGKVQVNGAGAKPATKVTVGDLVSARRGDEQIVYRVVTEIEKRVSATMATTCVEDLSPPAPPRDPTGIDAAFAPRGRGAGRPTKRDRRAIDRLRREM